MYFISSVASCAFCNDFLEWKINIKCNLYQLEFNKENNFDLNFCFQRNNFLFLNFGSPFWNKCGIAPSPRRPKEIRTNN